MACLSPDRHEAIHQLLYQGCRLDGNHCAAGAVRMADAGIFTRIGRYQARVFQVMRRRLRKTEEASIRRHLQWPF